MPELCVVATASIDHRRFAVTAVDPNSTSEPDGGAGHFPVVLRGYDRQLVDARLGELAGQLEQERRQRTDAEQKFHQLDGGNALAVRDQPTASFVSLGARAAKVFEEAGAVAERLIGEAQEQARAIVDAAQAEAAARLQAAEEQARELEHAAHERLAEAEAEQAQIEAEAVEAAQALRADADRDAKAERAQARDEIRRVWQKADRDRLLVEAEAQRLRTLRQILAEQLGQVHTHLGLALRATSDWTEDGGSDLQAGGGEPTAPDIEVDGDREPAIEAEQAAPPAAANATE
jgi:cell division septum initiation protein DivIVA